MGADLRCLLEESIDVRASLKWNMGRGQGDTQSRVRCANGQVSRDRGWTSKCEDKADCRN
jgi:hypothetical protein